MMTSQAGPFLPEKSVRSSENRHDPDSMETISPQSLCLLRRAISFCIWKFCVSVLSYFSFWVLVEYLRKNPITIITFVEPPSTPEPITVKICNNVFLDPVKVLNYNKSSIDVETLEFLKQTVNGNISYDDGGFVIATPVQNYFLLSETVLHQLKMDIESFMLSCIAMHAKTTDCAPQFQWVLEPGQACTKQLCGLGIMASFMVSR